MVFMPVYLKWLAGACSNPSPFVLFLVNFLEKMKSEGSGEQERTDLSFLVELCRLNYYLVIVITLLTQLLFDAV